MIISWLTYQCRTTCTTSYLSMTHCLMKSANLARLGIFDEQTAFSHTGNADLAVGTTWRHGTITNNGCTDLGNYMMILSKLLTNMLRCWSKTSFLKWARNAVVNRLWKFAIIHSGLVACNWNQSLEVLEESDVDPNTWTASRIPKHHHSRGNHLNPPVVLDFFGAPRE